MEIQVLGCSGSVCRDRLPLSLVVNRRIAIDGGSLPYALSIEEQRQLDGIIVSHSHMDHIAGLPFLLDTIMTPHRTKNFSIFLSDATRNALSNHIFNDQVWPALERYPEELRAKILWHIVEPGKEITICDSSFQFLDADHTVPSLGLVASNKRGWIGISSDTANLSALMNHLKGMGKPLALFLETTFPNRMRELAAASGHLTPEAVIGQLSDFHHLLPDDLYIYHMKPQYEDEIIADFGHTSSLPFRPLSRQTYRW